MVTSMVHRTMAARNQWVSCVHTGRATAAKLLQACRLRNAAGGAGGRRWTDAERVDAVDPWAATAQRVRQAVVEPGMAAV